MKIIIRPRQGGETDKLIKMATVEGYYKLIVCMNQTEVQRVWERCHILKDGGEIDRLPPMPITFNEFLDGAYYGRNVDGFLIDNADALLQSLAQSAPIEAISMTQSI